MIFLLTDFKQNKTFRAPKMYFHRCCLRVVGYIHDIVMRTTKTESDSNENYFFRCILKTRQML